MKTKRTKENVIYFLPNLFTMANLFCGFYSIIATLHDFYFRAAVAILIGGIFDSLDGKIARIMKQGDSKFGVEFDSLTDLVTFGLAPAMLVYLWSIESFGRIGWIACFAFVACGALRLARFNARSSTVSRGYFEGLPIPCAAGALVTTTLLYHELMLNEHQSYFNLILTVVLAALMVTNIKYRSFKDLDFKDKRSFGILALFVFVLAAIAINPGIMMFVVAMTYLISGPLSALFGKKKTLSTRRRKETAAPPLRLVEKED